MDLKLLPLYFVIGGATVTAITYFGSQGKGIIASFVALLPSITVITLCTIYLSSGTETTINYAKGMLILLPAWLLYVIAVILLLPRIGLAGSLVASISIYLATAYLIIRLFNLSH